MVGWLNGVEQGELGGGSWSERMRGVETVEGTRAVCAVKVLLESAGSCLALRYLDGRGDVWSARGGVELISAS